MSQVCRNCSRPNPPDALYCYYDGFSLGSEIAVTRPLASGTQPFLAPFVFPSGRKCRHFDELVRAAFDLWEEAHELLKDGTFAGFFGGLGRADLARLARQAMASPDSDRALDEFLAGLPSTARQPARLHIEPREINLGEVTCTETRALTLRIENKGTSLLHGTVASEETPWLVIGELPGVPQKLFECRRETTIPVQVIGERLRASSKALEGKLVIESNGGTATVMVKAEVPVRAFAEGVLAGAVTPRQIAEKARAAPKSAAPLFENGAVAAWYASNGWVYPIQGDQAPGLAAVQQFFEALGLTTPPRVEVSELYVKLQGPPGIPVEHTLQVTAVENRPVYLTTTSTVPWLRVDKPVLAGRTAKVRLIVPSIPPQPGESLLGRVQIIANGNQRFTVAVSLAIAASAPGVRIPRPSALSAPPPPAPTGAPTIADSPIAIPPVRSPVAPGGTTRPEPAPRFPSSPTFPPPRPAPARADESLPVPEPLLSIPPGAVWVPPVRPAPAPVLAAPPSPSGTTLGHLIPLGILIVLLLGTVIHDALL